MSSLQIVDYHEEVMKELIGLPSEKIHEVIDFIGYLKSKEAKKKRTKKIRSDIRDNPLLSIIGIGESEPPHDLAKNHDRYVYGDI